jgi:site-specific recombinase XerD
MQRCHPQPKARDHPIIGAVHRNALTGVRSLVCRNTGDAFKKTAKTGIGYLEKAEMDALLAQPDRRTPLGDRDHALLLFLYNSGARADEAARLTIDSLQLGTQSSVRLHGKGNKFRTCPLWPVTATSLSKLIANRGKSEAVFLNRSNQPLTRFGIHRLVTQYAEQASRTVPSMAWKRVSPHTIRHTTAVHLLRAGVDINTIRAWLGHVSLDTTHVYAEVDMEMRLLDVSSGFENIWERGSEQVDDGDVGSGVSVAAGTRPCGLEDAVQAFEAGVGVG